LDERRKLEVNRIKKIDKKNERIIKKNIKIKNLNRRNMKKMNIKQQCKNKVHKLEPLYDTTPTNPLLAEVSTHGNTPLHIAVVRCFAPEFQQLLIKVDNHGSHIDPKSNCCALRKSAKGKLPLHIACRGPFVGQNKVLYPFTIIEQLLQHAPESCKIPTNYGRLPLHLVLRAKANKSIVQLVLSSYPNAANVATKNGNYPLHIAIWNRASPSVIRMVLNHNKHASRIKSPSCSLYPIDMALEKCFGKKIISLLLRAACDAVGTNDTNDTNVTNVTNDINHSRVLSFRSQKRLKRLMPKLWLKCHATALVQTLARKKRQQTNYQKLKSSVSITQPWYRGVRVRKKNILIKKLRSIQTIQNTIRTYQAKKKKRRKQWAVTIVHQWIINFTWIQPTVVKNRQLTNEIVPDTTRVFFLDVYEAIAKRRISGVIIVQHLRNGYLSAKGQHGYKRAVNQVKLRHASATLINQTVKEWVCYQKMKRAFKPLLAFQCIRVWIRETPKLKFLRNKKLIRNVASTKIQSLSRGYVSRRNSIEIDSCIRIQAWFRCLSSWRKYRVKLHSAVQITKVQRALESRRKYWWIAKSPGLKRSRMFENQAKKVAYPQREGHHSNPPQGHYIPGNKHIFVNDKDRHEHKRLKLRMFLPTH
jgi:ankyrin repeat protein